MIRQTDVMSLSYDDFFYGSVTVGERGQIVIPAEARAEMGIKPGDKLLVMRHPMHKGLMISKIDTMNDFMEEFKRGVEKAIHEDEVSEESAEGKVG